MAESSPLFLLPGVRFGRVQPVGWIPPSGDWAMAFGSVEAGHAYDLTVGDRLFLSQDFDVTGVKLVRFRANLRPPSVMPTGRAWWFSWGVGAVTHGERELKLGRTRDMLGGTFHLSTLTGVQTLWFSLHVGYPEG